MKKKTMMFKIIPCMLIVILMFSMAGCSKSEKKKIAMGRYMDEKVTLPDGMNIYDVYYLGNLDDSTAELVAATEDGVNRYTYKDGKFHKEEHWAFIDECQTQGKYPSKVVKGMDGCFYIVYYVRNEETGNGSYEVCRYDGKKANILDIKEINEPQKVEGMEQEVNPYIDYASATKDGDVIYHNGYNPYTSLYSKSEKKTTLDYEIIPSIAMSDDRIYGLERDVNVIHAFDYSGNEKEKIETDLTLNSSMLYANQDNLTVLSHEGISTYNLSEKQWKQVVDGRFSEIMQEGFVFEGMACLASEPAKDKKEETHDSYIVAGRTQAQGLSILKYEFDKNIPTVPDTQLTVYSLVDNATIQQAIMTFQNKNQNVLVNHVVAMSNDEGEGASISDAIRSFNTQLLAKKGADIILLDGLPQDSYIEKGVLEDISDIANGLKDSYLPNLIDNYMQGGKCYGLPIRMIVPLLYGQPEVMESMKSLSSFADYVKKHKGEKLIPHMTSEFMSQEFLLLYYNEIINKDQTLNEDTFKTYLEMLKDLYGRYDENEPLAGLFGDSDMYGASILDIDEGFGGYQANKKDKMTRIGQIETPYDLVLPLAGVRDAGMSYDVFNHMYLPNGIISINANSKHKDLAEEFVRCVLSNEIQSVTLNDGFPVTTKAMDNMFKSVDVNNMTCGVSDENGGVAIVNGPKQELYDEATNKFKQINTPIVYDKILIDQIVDSVKDIFNGGKTVDEITQNAVNVVNTYLSE